MVDIVHAETRSPHANRPWVLLNMVASLDGATAIDGVSGGLGGPADKKMFTALRSLPDVVLVGAGTARSERYNPPLMPPAQAAAYRRAKGQTNRPRLCVLSASLRFDDDLAFLTDDPKPLVATSAATRANAPQSIVDSVEFVNVAGELQLPLVLELLGQDGNQIVLCEGGPTLNAQMLEHDLVDEICLTIAPLAVAGTSRRIAQGATPDAPRGFALDRILTEDGFLFVRYLRAAPVDE